MKRPTAWGYWIALGACAAVIVGQHVLLARLAPHYILRVAERSLSGTLDVDRTQVIFPRTVKLTGVRLAGGGAAALVVPEIVLRLGWPSWRTRTVRLTHVRIRQPLLRLARLKSGTVVWPLVPVPEAFASSARSPLGPWRVVVEQLSVEDGAIEFFDEQPPRPFHGVFDHVSWEAGPLALPLDAARTSFAVRGHLLGDAGLGAPLYCSGWAGLSAGDLQASCQLEPLALAAFDPYYERRGPVQVRVYDAHVQSTSQWRATANALEARLQFEFLHVKEGDLSVRGRTIVDLKKVTGGQESQMTGQLVLSGLLNDPGRWQSQFVPGDERVRQLVEPLLERGIAIIKVPVPGGRIDVGITTPPSEAAATHIEAVSKEVQKDLELLAVPELQVSPEPAPPAVPAPAEPVSVPPSAAPAAAATASP
jgi:hypothetical protein